MKVKKFYGANNHEVMSKVKRELGLNAVILHQRKIKPKGMFGFMKKSMIEVVAAIEEVEKTVEKPNVRDNSINMAKIQEYKLREKTELKSKDTELKKEIDDIKFMLGNVTNQIQNINLPTKDTDTDNKKDSYIYNILLKNEVDEELISEILINNESLYSKDIEEIKGFLTKAIPDSIDNKNINSSSKIMFFVGPTGVGKTTTIAKIAAKYSLEKGLDVGLISSDTYRIAAVEQLKVYSDILNIPLEVIYSPKEIHNALDNLNNKDVIMIDTAGRSHKNNKHVEELNSLLNEVGEKTVYLVVSSTTKFSDLKDILNVYSFIDNYKIIFTKVDEVSTYGPILNIAIKHPEYISYITNGQSVPDDIEVLTSNIILDMLLKEI